MCFLSRLRGAVFVMLFAILLSPASARGETTFCSQYARTAVKQNQLNQQLQCGFSGLRWSNDRVGQMRWCLTVRTAVAENETRARRIALEQCLARQQLETRNVAPPKSPGRKSASASSRLNKKSKQQKYPDVQRLVAAKAVSTSLADLPSKDLNGFFKKVRVQVFPFALSNSARWLAQGSHKNNDSSLKLWDLQQGRLLYLLGEAGGKAYIRLAFSPDEDLLVAGDNDTTDIWDWRNARLLFRIKGYYLPLSAQLFDAENKLYLIHKDKNKVVRFDPDTAKQEKQWLFGIANEGITEFSVNKRGDFAFVTHSFDKAYLKIFGKLENRIIFQKEISSNNGFYSENIQIAPGNRHLFFTDSEHLIFKQSADSKETFIFDFNTKQLSPSLNKPAFFEQYNFCLQDIGGYKWNNRVDLKCQLKNQRAKNNLVVSSYRVDNQKTFTHLGSFHQLNDKNGHLLAYFGADSGGRWYWLDAMHGKLKNAAALWSDLPDPNRQPAVYHFPAQFVHLKENQKIARQYAFPKTDIQRLEVFLGSNRKIKYTPTIKPVYGNSALSHNGRWLVIGGQDGDGIAHLDLWDVTRGNYLKSFQSKIAWTNTALAFSPDDHYLLVYYGSTRGHYAPCIECQAVVDIWDLGDIKHPRYKFSIPLLDRNNQPSEPVILANGDMYLNIDNRVIQHWNIQQERLIDTFHTAGEKQEIFAVTANGDDLLALSIKKKTRNKEGFLSSATSWIEIWRISDHTLLKKINIMQKPVEGGLEFNAIFVSAGEIAVSTRHNDIMIWDALTAKKLKTLVPGKDFGFTYGLSSERNGILISSGDFLQRWDIKTGQLLITLNACQPDMPGLPTQRYTQLKQYHGYGSARVANGKVLSTYACPQGGRGRIWNMQTGESKALFGKNRKGEWFWLNDQEILKSTVAPP